MSVRAATHAGSWYSADPVQLRQSLNQWLQNVPLSTEDDIPIPVRGARAIIAPHAGYAYSGETAAYAYKCVDTTNIKRVFILGPSHHVYLSGCAVSECTEYATPLGSLKLDREVIAELKATGQFESMSKQTDEDEHSIEMHLPYIYKIMEDKAGEYTIVPILVGALNRLREEFYGKLLAPYLADSENLFVISSDFCHWGRRFSYTFYTIVDPPSHAPGTVKNVTTFTVPIHSCIERLDREGMQLIERLDPHVFHDYLKRSRNTICGRHPISVLLWALNQLYVDPPQLGIDDGDDSDCATATTETLDDSRPAPSAGMRAAMATLLAGATPGHRETGPVIRFTRYAQSNRVKRPSESSVSYAAAYVYIPDGVKAHQLQLDQA